MRYLLSLVLLFVSPSASAAQQKSSNPWSLVAAPTASAPSSIGSYSAGCLDGAQEMAMTGPGYQVMRPSRRRNFGHPALIHFLQDLALQIKSQTQKDLLIGDMGLPRGGPTMSGHSSHQIGLDVDLWFWQAPPGKILSNSERESTSATSMIVPEFKALTTEWNSEKGILVKSAAEMLDVERIFVNPLIKKELCQMYPGGKWLSKVRPWWFHENHFHVRLHCQPGNGFCVKQEAVPAGNGCNEELSSWFTAEARRKEHEMRISPKPAVMPVLPPFCSEVLKK